ncbi:MAG: OsmC family peroxiredoxin [Phycisphaerales bacterium]|nr:OsmC family peroxiredoxin [Phycisphaerales bacterium]
MSEHTAAIRWSRTSDDFSYASYNREHTWAFDGGVEVPASAAPQYKGDPACVDPEEALVAGLSACHMLTFLAVASKKGLVVDTYDDDPVGVLEKNEDGKLAVTRVTLRPLVTFGGDAPSDAMLRDLHHAAHDACFLANSVRTHIDVEPR